MKFKKFKSLSIFYSQPESKIKIWVPFNTIKSILNLKKSYLRSFLNFDILTVVKVSDLAISFIQNIEKRS